MLFLQGRRRDDIGVSVTDHLNQRVERASRGAVFRTLARSTGTVLSLLLVYALLPVGTYGIAPLVFFIFGVGAFIFSVWWQSRAIVTSPTPILQAVEALALLVPLAVFVSAGAYLIISVTGPEAFNESLDKIDAVRGTSFKYAREMSSVTHEGMPA